jgi:hypothetical protein
MNWKQFLKPDHRKIAVVFTILFLEFVWALIYYTPEPWSSPSFNYNSCCRNGLSEYTNKIGCIPLPNMTQEEFCLMLKDESEKESLQSSIIFIIDLVTVYLLSCSIIWIYEKIRKK